MQPSKYLYRIPEEFEAYHFKSFEDVPHLMEFLSDLGYVMSLGYWKEREYQLTGIKGRDLSLHIRQGEWLVWKSPINDRGNVNTLRVLQHEEFRKRFVAINPLEEALAED